MFAVGGMCFGMVGCSTKSSLEGLNPTMNVSWAAKFESREIEIRAWREGR